MYKTLKEYAQEEKISYEAARAQASRYSADLEGHYTKQGNKRLYDEYAINFLREHRKNNPVVIVQEGKAERLEELEEEVKRLKSQNDELKNQLLQADQKIIALQDIQIEIAENRAKYNLLEDLHQKTEEQLSEAREQLSSERIRAEQAEAEAGSYHKSIFGFYRKR